MSVFQTPLGGVKRRFARKSVAAFALICATSACMSPDTASQSNIAKPASISTMSEQSQQATSTRPAKAMQVVGQGPARAGRPVYICGPSGGGMKSSCYQM